MYLYLQWHLSICLKDILEKWTDWGKTENRKKLTRSWCLAAFISAMPSLLVRRLFWSLIVPHSTFSSWRTFIFFFWLSLRSCNPFLEKDTCMELLKYRLINFLIVKHAILAVIASHKQSDQKNLCINESPATPVMITADKIITRVAGLSFMQRFSWSDWLWDTKYTLW